MLVPAFTITSPFIQVLAIWQNLDMPYLFCRHELPTWSLLSKMMFYVCRALFFVGCVTEMSKCFRGFALCTILAAGCVVSCLELLMLETLNEQNL